MDVLRTISGRRGPLVILTSGFLFLAVGIVLRLPETPAARGADAPEQSPPPTTPPATPSPSSAGVMTLVQVLQDQSAVVNAPSREALKPTPQLSAIVKTDDRETVAPGEFLTYRIVVRNDGEEPAASVRVVDRVPASLIPDLPSITPAGAADADTRTITWSDQTIPPHADTLLTFRAQVHPAVPPGFVVHNVADVAAPGFLGSAADRTTVVGAAPPAAPPAPKGAITISAPRPVPIGVETGMDASTALLGFGTLLSGTGAVLARRYF